MKTGKFGSSLSLGQANYGHYWIYIYDREGQQWWKYNDSRVTKVTYTNGTGI